MNEVTSATNTLSAFISSESLKLFLGVLIPGAVRFFISVMKKTFDIQPTEKAAATEKRAKVLTRISCISSKNVTDTAKNTLKAYYETIGMFYPVSINERLLTFLREKSIAYDDRDFQSFIRAPLFPDIQRASVEHYNVRYRKKRKQTALFSGIFFLILLIALMFFAGMAKSSTGSDKTIFIVMTIVFYLLSLFFSFLIMNEFEHSRRARVFYKKFAPWLKQKMAEEDQA